jgi:hypothetical protein
MDGFCGHLHNYVADRRLETSERAMIEHIIARLRATLDADESAKQKGT